MNSFISITNAYAKNLKQISLKIPHYRCTAITGLSGTGKSTLLKDILAAQGIEALSTLMSPALRRNLRIHKIVEADSVKRLPATLFIDSKVSLSNPISTISTYTGIHELLRNLFVNYGTSVCPHCGLNISRTITPELGLCVDLKNDTKGKLALDFIKEYGQINCLKYYGKNREIINKHFHKAIYLYVEFEWKTANETKIYSFNHDYSCRVCTIDGYDLLRFSHCPCGAVLPRITRERISFNTPFEEGGGRCRCCSGLGKRIILDEESLILDENKSMADGGLRFTNLQGVARTSINTSILKVAAKKFNYDLYKPINCNSSQALNGMLYGDGTPLTPVVSKPERTVKYIGIIGSLIESYRKGNGGPELEGICHEEVCPVCQGSRVDPDIECFSLFGNSLSKILSMSLNEMLEWLNSSTVSSFAIPHVDKIKHCLSMLRELSCGYLTLSRASCTLSGGELQRLRLGSSIVSQIKNICYLLDEPSIGLHGMDIERLGGVLRKLCKAGNTVILVDHNPYLLRYCDYIVDMGINGGDEGGYVNFSDTIDNIAQYDTPTTRVLHSDESNSEISCGNLPHNTEWLNLPAFSANNLLHIKTKIPKDKFSVICGTSGSGKSTFIKHGIFSPVSSKLSKYSFNEIIYLSQGTSAASSTSTVCTLLNLSKDISKRFAKLSGLNAASYLRNSLQGKCLNCSGKGYYISAEGVKIGMCESCHGVGFNQACMSQLINGYNIAEVLNAPLSRLGEIFDESRFIKISEMASLLGVGYLSLSRESKSLSKGEYQRVKLAEALYENKKNCLYLLDEPSKGLHSENAEMLILAIKKITSNQNTVVAVEHNSEMIKQCDYLIEFGRITDGTGKILYEGVPSCLSNTPTALMLQGKLQLGGILRTHLLSDRIIEDNSETLIPVNISDVAKSVWHRYLSMAFPNNSLYSQDDYMDNSISTPMIHTIDFMEKKRAVINLYELLGIEQWLIREVQSIFPYQKELLRYVFDFNSTTGKCSACEGKGTIQTIPFAFFVEENKLSRNCMKFLRSLENFSEIKTALQKEYGINLTSSLDKLDDTQRNILLHGIPDDGTNHSANKWMGIMSYFLKNHKYYPDLHSNTVFNEREVSECPMCGGKRVSSAFQSVMVCNMSYSMWLQTPISEILKRIPNSPQLRSQRIKQVLNNMCAFGLGNFSLSKTLTNLDSIQASLAQLCAILSFRDYGATILLRNTKMLDEHLLLMMKTACEEVAQEGACLFC